MAIRKVKVDDEFIYIEDEVKEEEKDYPIKSNVNLDDTLKMEPINEKDFLEDTLTDIFGDNNE